MKKLGLSSGELIAFAMIYAYTGFRGSYDGDLRFIAEWSRTPQEELSDMLDGMCLKRVIERTCGRYGNICYRSIVTAAAALSAKPAADNINNINNINDINDIKKRIDKNNMNDMNDINNIDNKEDMKDTAFKSSSSDMKDTKKAKPRSGRSFMMDKEHTEALMELIYPYTNIVDAPIELLEEKIRILEEREMEKAEQKMRSQPQVSHTR